MDLKFLVLGAILMCCFSTGYGRGILLHNLENDEVKNYEGYMVLKIKPLTEKQHEFIADFLDNYHGDLDIWKSLEIYSGDNNTSTNVMVPPELVDFVREKLHEHNIEYSVLVQNLKDKIAEERELQKNYTRSGKISFDHYYRHAEINEYLDHLGTNFPSLVKVFSIGKSYEGRDLKMVHIGEHSSQGEKPIVFIDGGIHAREWIAPAQVLYIIHQLVENYSENKDLLKHMDWYIIPVVNPDGYEFSHEKDRLWRRTRSENILSALPKCVGVDGNRNWDIYWGGFNYAAATKTASRNDRGHYGTPYGHIPCIDDYAGPEPFSEIEIKQLADFAKTIASSIKLYITFHSHGSKILYPWGYTDTLPANAQELTRVGNMVRDSLIEPYTVGSSANALYFLTGSSKDYFKDILGVDLSYTIELPAGGSSGFDLPPKKIHGVVKDMFNGVRTFGKYVQNKFYYLWKL